MSLPTLLGPHQFLARKSLVELNARERAQALLDEGSYRELLGPFERLESPWLLMQGVGLGCFGKSELKFCFGHL